MSATRCCSASPARARPSPWPRSIEATAAPRPDPGAQQDAGRPALQRVQELLPGERGRVFRLLLRLLPAGSLYPAHRHLYREGLRRERGDRPHAPFGDAGDPGARRRHHRGLGLLHLRHRLGRDLFRHRRRHSARRHGSTARRADAESGRRCNTSRNDDNFARGAFRVRGDTIDIFPAHYEDRAWRVELFGDDGRHRSPSSIR